MEKEVKGMVKRNPVYLEQGCIFVVEQDNGYYLVLSTDRQAVKDNIFVEQGQEIRIKGSYLETSELKGIVVTNEAEIQITEKNNKK